MKKNICSVLFFACLLYSCGSNDAQRAAGGSDSLAIRKAFAESPVISPEESLKKMRVEEGFAVQLVAAEPLVVAPVALTFDERGRMWVTEMQGYMPDTSGAGEDQGSGKIIILEDKNDDGIADTRTVFLDSLVLPRAICLLEGGVLVAEPPRLWFVERNGDKPGKKILVDDKYADGGNPEHQPNGLLRAMDNWIYSANSTKRYKKQGDHWLIENTHLRGQWGISQDDYGRLFYNNNSVNLLGDYFAPSLGASNKNQLKAAGFNEKIVPDNRVYPARATTGVNRGYMKGILDSSLRLVDFTAACGPLIYRGNAFGKDFQGNAFVAEPAANLIKRNILKEEGYRVTGFQAYKEKEFLTSTDERFRPVNLYNGPDGALYVLDMYRGIIEHKTYLTEYLKDEIKNRELSQPLSCGRIYKIVPLQKSNGGVVKIPGDPLQLVALLEQQNGWLRDKAQELIVDNRYAQTIPLLRRMFETDGSPGRLNALWTLEGLGALTSADILPLLKNPDWHLRVQALTAISFVMANTSYKQYLPYLMDAAKQKDTLQAPWMAFLVQTIKKFDKQAADQLLFTLIQNYPQDKFVAAALVSSMEDNETAFLKRLAAVHLDSTILIRKQLNNVLADIGNSMNARNAKMLEKKYPLGANLFKSVCQTCHGKDGNGIQSLAPPLNRSEWVLGDQGSFAAIVLFGMTGPVKVNDKLYTSPEINGDMPGIGNNKALTDGQIAEVLSFIRNSWGNKADEIKPAVIAAVRAKYAGREKTFTMEELRRKK